MTFLLGSMFGFWSTFWIFVVLITPVSMTEFVLSNPFQLMTGFGLSVLIPNFTDWFSLIDSDDEKTITPCEFFSPTHPFSVLKDSNFASWLSQILNVLISSVPSFMNVIIDVFSTPILFTLISSAYPFDGTKINETENNITTESKIPLFWDFFMFVIFFIFDLNSILI